MLEPLRSQGGPKIAQGPKIDSKCVPKIYDFFRYAFVIPFQLGQLIVISCVVKDKKDETRQARPRKDETRRDDWIQENVRQHKTT